MSGSVRRWGIMSTTVAPKSLVMLSMIKSGLPSMLAKSKNYLIVEAAGAELSCRNTV